MKTDRAIPHPRSQARPRFRSASLRFNRRQYRVVEVVRDDGAVEKFFRISTPTAPVSCEITGR